MKYFHINNIKFNYDLEFKNNSNNNFWKQNTPLIEYCETLGINVPHYCYHKNLSISGNCRMCLVELKNSPKPIVSCAMNAKSCLANGDIYTNSSLVKKARENVLEFLLLNHPLDCPICDQGGECDLQDQSLFFGLTKKRFYSFKRVVLDKNIGPIVKTVMTRCIHCTRCVRFAAEIAGVEDIGMFGRGLQSEIGTYVEKIFQSELSGNVIDLCPVGALTSKPYPFVNRNWELKNVTSIDFSDGFGTPVQLFLKNNQIIKILPGYEEATYKTNWISDKTRFSFDGMFSPERIIYSFLNKNRKESSVNLSWQKLFKEFFCTLYFQNHLLKHYFHPCSITICLNKNINIEVLNLLRVLTHKHSFFKLRQSESTNLNIDLEENYLLNSSLNENSLLSADTCLLLGINPRYEASKLNLKLKSRYLKGNFKVVTLGSLFNLTFSNTTLSSNVQILKSLVEGNNLFCQEFINSSNPILISSTEIFKREDAYGLSNMIKFLTKHINLYSQCNSQSQLNILSTTLNDVGFANFNNLKTIKNKDFRNSAGIYFINSSFSTPNIKKLLNLKLLNFFQSYKHKNKLLITEDNNLEVKQLTKLKKGFNINNHLHLPNTVFFENSGTYINTEGTFNKTVKIITPLGQAKNDWQIIRKVFSYSKKLLFITNFFRNNKIVFNSKNVYQFKNYVGLQHYAISNLNNLEFKFKLLLVSYPNAFKYTSFILRLGMAVTDWSHISDAMDESQNLVAQAQEVAQGQEVAQAQGVAQGQEVAQAQEVAQGQEVAQAQEVAQGQGVAQAQGVGVNLWGTPPSTPSPNMEQMECPNAPVAEAEMLDRPNDRLEPFPNFLARLRQEEQAREFAAAAESSAVLSDSENEFRANGSEHSNDDSRANGSEHSNDDSRASGSEHSNDDSRANSSEHSNDDSRANSSEHSNDDSRANGSEHSNGDSRASGSENSESRSMEESPSKRQRR